MSANQEPPTRTTRGLVQQYGVYVVVGVGVTLISVLLRELIGLVIADDSPAGYRATIVVTYALGIPLSLVAHHKMTFRGSAGLTLAAVTSFGVIQLIGLGLNLLASTWLRSLLLGILGNTLTKPIAFGVAALLVSVATFALKKALVFHPAATPQ